MKVKVFSDIHLEHYVGCQVFPHVGRGDILILAGDILCAKHFKTNGYLHDVYKTFLESCSNGYERVLYVKGNHEFYGYNYEGTHGKILDNLPDNFTLLENDRVEIGGWNFTGFTLWTNFRNANPLEMMEAEQCMNDYRVIRIGSNYRKLRAQDTLNFHLDSRNYLLEQLSLVKGNTFVISHHAPSLQSIHEQFKHMSNGAYCSNLDHLILENPQIKYWVHGHTHTPFDYKIGQCRVICNPVGYPGQDTGYDPCLHILLP